MSKSSVQRQRQKLLSDCTYREHVAVAALPAIMALTIENSKINGVGIGINGIAADCVTFADTLIARLAE